MKILNLSIMFILTFVVSCGDDTVIRDSRSAEPCTVAEDEEKAIISCPDGSVAEVTKGEDGQDGENGVDGQNGTSCSVYDINKGAVIECEDGSSVTIKDGTDNTEPVYIGYYCSKNVLRIGKRYYVLNGNLVLLNDNFYKVNNSCKIKVVKNEIITE